MEKSRMLHNRREMQDLFIFNNIPAGNISFKLIKIQNLTKRVQHYQIERNPVSKPPNDAFAVMPKKMSVKPGDSFTFKLKFSPDTSSTSFHDYFEVWDTSGLCSQFGVKGNSTGPAVHASVNKLQFTCSSKSKGARKAIELTNDSSVEAIYQFDIDLNNGVFKTDTVLGSISPGHHIYVEIMFCPFIPGIYTQELFCLIHNQRPVKITLEGYFSTNDIRRPDNSDAVRFSQPGLTINMFDTYFADSLLSYENSASLTISANNIDFGQSDLEQSQSVPLTVTNTTAKELLFSWDKDLENTFVIEPQSTIIYGNDFETFQAYFHPKKKDNFFSTKLDGYGNFHYLIQEKTPVVDHGHKSIHLSVRMMGHTFPEGKCGWVPQFDIPSFIKMPPCVPPVPVYATFMIKRLGHLPLLFKFIPPQKTHYLVKPMQGLITNEYQIVAVRMCPDGRDEKSYCEQWTIQFNSSSRHGKIEFLANAEYPRLETLTNPKNQVHFPTMFAGCEETMIVPVQNVSRHSIWCEDPSLESPINILNNCHLIGPNEVVYQKWHMKSQEIGRHEIEVTIETFALHESLYPVGVPVEMSVLTILDCEYVGLVAFPRNVNFGASQLNIQKSKTFKLYNFGKCDVPFSLQCVHRGITLQRCEQDITIHPNYGKLPANDNIEITVNLYPSQMGLQEFAIKYQIKKNEWSDELTHHQPAIIFYIDYEGILPLMKVLELTYDIPGILISQLQLWQFMNITRFNEAFVNTVPNTTTVIDMNFPEAPIGTLPITINLYLKNIGTVATSWKVKRQQNCSCIPVVRNTRFSFKDKAYECKHKEMFTICEPCEGVLQQGELHIMKLLIQYHMEGCWELTYAMELSHNRKIQINAHIVVFSDKIPYVSTFMPSLNLQNIFIGDGSPTMQFFWLYNNSNEDAEYELNTRMLESLKRKYFNASIISCMNPTDIIKSKNLHPVIFKFHPCELQCYKALLPLRLGSNEIKLKITGDGAVCHDNNIRKMLHKAPIRSDIEITENPIVFSTNHIIIGKPFLTNSRMERIFFIESRTNEVYGYKFHEYELPNILKITVSPAKGILEPHETHQLNITVVSQNYPALITVPIKADVLSQDAKRSHDKSLRNHEEAKKKLQGGFVITEAGFSTPVNEAIIPPELKSVCMVLPVTCHISNPTQMDIKFPLYDQLKLTPGTQLDIHPPTKMNLTEEATTNVLSILEKIIWEELNSKWFEKAISEWCVNGNSHYCQFPMNKYGEQSKSSCMTAPSRELLHSVLSQTISDTLQKTFVFDKKKD